MSGFEDYRGELDGIDREIAHYAGICGVDLADGVALRACLREQRPAWADDRARASLKGLLMLRLKVETEMLEQGLRPPGLGDLRLFEDAPEDWVAEATSGPEAG